MLVVHGLYKWKPRLLAFRNDYCRKCEAERLSVLIRTIDVIHVFWIPVLPVGAWSRWHCGSCGASPHQLAKTRRGFKIAGAVVFALPAVAFWFLQPDADVSAWWLWTLRLVLTGLALLAFWSAFRHKPEPQFKLRLSQVHPYESRECPFCGGYLLNLPTWHCPNCGVEHRPLAQTPGVVATPG